MKPILDAGRNYGPKGMLRAGRRMKNSMRDVISELMCVSGHVVKQESVTQRVEV